MAVMAIGSARRHIAVDGGQQVIISGPYRSRHTENEELGGRKGVVGEGSSL